jgi:hypothetical protein
MKMQFETINPSLENYWRAIILFGRNVASYKFALAKSLLELSNSPRELVKLEDLAEPFSRHICEHLLVTNKQATSPTSRFLDVCRKFNEGQVDKAKLLDATVSLGFNNVIDAFHIVNDRDISERFFLDARRQNQGIIITENFFRLAETSAFENFNEEVESRWRLVETAWELNIARSAIAVSYDSETQLLFTGGNTRRANITSCRSALNGYQKGKCFYCNADVSVVEGSDTLADIDHFFPHILKASVAIGPIDGIWNLVLSCKSCNRGESGKFARVPSILFLEKLSKRNEYLIRSHHPLRETLMQQTGSTELERHIFIQNAYNLAKRHLIHEWMPEIVAEDLL